MRWTEGRTRIAGPRLGHFDVACGLSPGDETSRELMRARVVVELGSQQYAELVGDAPGAKAAHGKLIGDEPRPSCAGGAAVLFDEDRVVETFHCVVESGRRIFVALLARRHQRIPKVQKQPVLPLERCAFGQPSQPEAAIGARAEADADVLALCVHD